METLDKDSQHQSLIDAAYRGWVDDVSYPDFIESLPPIHRVAVLTGNLNAQVVEGGFFQWDLHGFSSCGDMLIEALYEVENYRLEATVAIVRDIVGQALMYLKTERRDFVKREELHAMLDEHTGRYLDVCDEFMAEVEVYLMRKTTPMRQSA